MTNAIKGSIVTNHLTLMNSNYYEWNNISNKEGYQSAMSLTDSMKVTELLVAWGNGDEHARDKLIPIIYDDLRRIARSYLRREQNRGILQTTLLVHEAYIRLVNVKQVQFSNRSQFFALTAYLIRQILVDHSRNNLAAKRGKGSVEVSLNGLEAVLKVSSTDILDLDNALKQLEILSPRQKEIVELRVFAGLSNAEIAEVLGVSTRTIDREWLMARAWLQRELGSSR